MTLLLWIPPLFAIWLGGALLIIRHEAKSKIQDGEVAFGLAIIWPLLTLIALITCPLWIPVLILHKIAIYLDLVDPDEEDS